jgi:hypothetical protein
LDLLIYMDINISIQLLHRSTIKNIWLELSFGSVNFGRCNLELSDYKFENGLTV